MSESSQSARLSGEELLPVVYDELRRLARQRMARERPGQTLQPTALVHEAYMRLGGDDTPRWENRGHFFAAAAESMRRILVERARRYSRDKHGAGQRRITLDEGAAEWEERAPEVLAVDQVLERLEERDPAMARVVKLRYFVGLTVPETAEALDLSPRSVNRLWTAARAWLFRELGEA